MDKEKNRGPEFSIRRLCNISHPQTPIHLKMQLCSTCVLLWLIYSVMLCIEASTMPYFSYVLPCPLGTTTDKIYKDSPHSWTKWMVNLWLDNSRKDLEKWKSLLNSLSNENWSILGSWSYCLSWNFYCANQRCSFIQRFCRYEVWDAPKELFTLAGSALQPAVALISDCN